MNLPQYSDIEKRIKIGIFGEEIKTYIGGEFCDIKTRKIIDRDNIVDDIVKLIIKRIKKKYPINEERLYSSGYIRKESGHIICVYTKRLDDEKYEAILFYSGNGLRYHKHDKISGKYMGMVRKIISKDQMIELNAILLMFNNVYASIDLYYKYVGQIFGKFDESEQDDTLEKISFIEPQLSGSCTYYGLYYFIQYYMYKNYGEIDFLDFDKR